MREPPTQILPFLFLGTHLNGRDEPGLLSLGITRILNVTDSARFVEDSSILVKHVPVSDFGDTNLMPVVKMCCDFISQAKFDGRKVLVHCRHGQNRSPAIVLAYLMAMEGVSLREAYDRVVVARPRVAIHEAYLEQLRKLEFAQTGVNTLSQDDIGPSVQEWIRRLRAEESE